MPQYLVHADPQFLVVKDDRASKKPLGYDAQIHKEMIRIVMERHYDLGVAFAFIKSTIEVTG